MKDKYHCSNCNGLRKHEILFKKVISKGEDVHCFSWINKYLVIECSGCENISFAKIYSDSNMYFTGEDGELVYDEETTIYPFYLEKGAELKDIYFLPAIIGTVYIETINAFKAKSYILTAAGFRAIIEAVCKHLKIRKDDLADKINALYTKGYLTKKESDRLHSIRFLGNDSLHEIEVPEADQLYIALEINNHLLENLFLQDRKLSNKIAVIIDDYYDFLRLIKSNLKDSYINKEMTVAEILGKSRRLISKKDFEGFELKLQKELNEGLYDFLSILKVNSNNNTVYKINRLPNFSFDLF